MNGIVNGYTATNMSVPLTAVSNGQYQGSLNVGVDFPDLTYATNASLAFCYANAANIEASCSSSGVLLAQSLPAWLLWADLSCQDWRGGARLHHQAHRQGLQHNLKHAPFFLGPAACSLMRICQPCLTRPAPKPDALSGEVLGPIMGCVQNWQPCACCHF